MSNPGDPRRDLRPYAVITLAYWTFTLTDGALRMLVLLYLHQLGYAPFEIAALFLFYELFGIVTNFLGGYLAARFGLKATLTSGLALQWIALALLASGADALSVPLVMVAQALSGIAKDLTKLSAKSYVRLVVPEHDQHGLLRWVAILTGSKNTLKGVGFFLGGLLLTTTGFRTSLVVLATAILVALAGSYLLLPRAPGRASSVSLRSLVSTNPRVNWLSAARLFLFGARDVWFVLALPIFLQSVLGWTFVEVGGFLALWVIGYGLVQAAAPALVGRATPPDAGRLQCGTALLVIPLGAIILGLHLSLPPAITLIAGLALFGIVFALDSAMHSYLIVAYAEGDAVALRVGFYYAANALGRLIGTLLSGAVFQAAGLGRSGLIACLWTSLGFVLVSALFCLPLARSRS